MMRILTRLCLLYSLLYFACHGAFAIEAGSLSITNGRFGADVVVTVSTQQRVVLQQSSNLIDWVNMPCVLGPADGDYQPIANQGRIRFFRSKLFDPPAFGVRTQDIAINDKSFSGRDIWVTASGKPPFTFVWYTNGVASWAETALYHSNRLSSYVIRSAHTDLKIQVTAQNEDGSALSEPIWAVVVNSSNAPATMVNRNFQMIATNATAPFMRYGSYELITRRDERYQLLSIKYIPSSTGTFYYSKTSRTSAAINAYDSRLDVVYYQMEWTGKGVGVFRAVRPGGGYQEGAFKDVTLEHYLH